MMPSPFASNELASVVDFVRVVKQRVVAAGDFSDEGPTAHPRLVIGNEAGDADSILSAIGLAYVKTLQKASQDDGDMELTIPIVSIPAASLKFQRPETTYLLADCAGMENIKDDVNDLIAIDQDELLPKQAKLTITDHNFFRKKEDFDWVVTEIVDHHSDEKQHLDTCPSSERNIAFEDAKALVASATTLVAEEFFASAGEDKMPPTLAILLLGTMLLDTVNMSPNAGKGTPRDDAVMQRVLEETDWSQLNLPNEILAIDSNGETTHAPDPTRLFEKLQDAKFSPDFWNGLTAEQAIGMDFKSFSVPATDSISKSSLGIGSILLEMDHFFQKHENVLLQTMARIMEEDQHELLGLMFNTLASGDQKRRQLAISSYDKPTVDKLIKYLTVDKVTNPDLEIEVLHTQEEDEAGIDKGTLYVVRMEQGNVAASRKQVAPILTEFFKKHR
jgi:exopolyphosphatase